MEALNSDLIGTVDQNHTKLFQFDTELEMSEFFFFQYVACIILSLEHYFSPKFSQYSWLTGLCNNWITSRGGLMVRLIALIF